MNARTHEWMYADTHAHLLTLTYLYMRSRIFETIFALLKNNVVCVLAKSLLSEYL